MADDSGPRADYGGDDVEIPGHVRVKVLCASGVLYGRGSRGCIHSQNTRPDPRPSANRPQGIGALCRVQQCSCLADVLFAAGPADNDSESSSEDDDEEDGESGAGTGADQAAKRGYVM